MSRRKPTLRLPSTSAFEDAWLRQATAVAIEKARAVINDGAVLPPNTPVGRLSDTELGWIVCAGIFGWISERAAQATANGFETEKCLRTTGMDPDPWDFGAIGTILPELATCEAIDWNKSLAQVSRDEMICFLGVAYTLIGKAMLMRELSGITRKPPGTAGEAEAIPAEPDFVPF
jgi:hypothetical protein